ncbi:hypothetical protein MRBBS_2803 [Marinobacter sp. BSs20148]|nr:hypothetical protein MRBBS_2803 [Marinobacter sp. BSs20148]
MNNAHHNHPGVSGRISNHFASLPALATELWFSKVGHS